MEKEKDFEKREYFVAYLEMCVLNMFENIRSINMELDSIAFLTTEKKNPDYEIIRKKEIDDLRKNKMEVVKLTSVKINQTLKKYCFIKITISFLA